MTAQQKIKVICITCIILALVQLVLLISRGHTYSHNLQVYLGLGIGMSICGSLLTFNMCIQYCSPFISIQILILKYAFYWMLWLMKRKHFKSFQKSNEDCTKAQREFLLRTIRTHKDTEYGKDFNLKDINTVEDFIKKHPLTTYNHYRSYIKRVAKGEQGIMFHQKPSVLGKTSGTTGLAKVFPVTEEYMKAITRKGNAITSTLRNRAGIPDLGPLQMTCSLLAHGAIGFSEGGTPVGSVTRFMMSDAIREILFCTPSLGSSIVHEPTSMYIHALFALRDEQLGSIWAPFASSLFIFFRFLEVSWNMLVQDIRNGSISDKLKALSSRDREELNRFLYPMPMRAYEIERQFRKGFDNIVRRLWPRMPVLYGVTSGSMQPFVSRLKKYCGDLKILSGFYISTEGLIGYACEFPDDGQTKYVCAASGIFCEFIPAAYCDDENPGTLLMDEVRVGECYELVITNTDGLYRYRMGDVVLITGFYDTTPIFQFQYRNGELLSLCAEKTSEIAVTKALNETAEKWDNVGIAHYVCAESPLYDEARGANDDLSTDILYYVIFVELSPAKDTMLASDINEHMKFEAEFDANLRTFSESYDRCREKSKLGPPRVIFLDQYAFSNFRGLLLETSSASAAQLKIPKKLRKLKWVQLFLAHKIKIAAADDNHNDGGTDRPKSNEDLV
ncbi:jasmonoyl--L-amino acid synthetase JAR4-like [Lytechinus variegatus]|uniref:jasmonoyl--L-amino acid synthetase JAR4-like n=1 Tax=Lytechinus variegatus TaxID=7654 RepID=UPI001BB0E680|nr:jasmonoyl--L-amino acid synthetase JAR4-like [Lytechinus variegatus]